MTRFDRSIHFQQKSLIKLLNKNDTCDNYDRENDINKQSIKSLKLSDFAWMHFYYATSIQRK